LIYPNIDQKMYPDFLETVQELNMNDLISLLKDWIDSYLYDDLKDASGYIEVLTNEIRIRTNLVPYEICCECGLDIPLNRLKDHPVLCTQKEA